MRRLVSIAIGVVAVTTFAFPLPAHAEDREELIVERIHSDLPLYTFQWDDIWPRGFSSDDGFGCVSRVGFGDWRFTPADGEDGEEWWERYSNYGVFHCAAIIQTAEEQAELADGQLEYGYFVLIGKTRLGSKKWELWALQKGTVPGSEYVLLARESGLEDLVDSFRVLQRRCPPGKLRQTRGLDVWSTRYCSIDSRADLLTLARRMLRRPSAGTITRVAKPDEGREAED